MDYCCNRAEEILSESARRWPDQLAVTALDRCVSYARLNRAADRICAALTGAGIPRGSMVGISLEQGRYFLAALFGILRSRCVAISIAPNLSRIEKDRLIAEAGVSAVIVEARNSAYLDTSLIDDPYGMGASLVLERRPRTSERVASFSDAAIVRYTSGTTGVSKGVVLSHRAVIERAQVSKELLDVREGDAILAALPLSYHFIASAVAFISAGANILDCEGLSGAEMIDLGASYRASILYASPSQYELLCRAESDRDLTALRRAISTSEIISCRTAETFKARFKRYITQVYGIIEVGLPLWNDEEVLAPFALGLCKAPYECAVVDDRGEGVGESQIGELVVRGPGLFSGYIVGDSHVEPRQPDQWVYTGDLVSRDSTGAITYHGRKKSVIHFGKDTIFPEEIEEVLRRSPEIQAARVSAEPHDSCGSKLVAEIVLVPQAGPAIDAWRALCRKELSECKVPAEFRIVESLPSTGTGKLVRGGEWTTPDSTHCFESP